MDTTKNTNGMVDLDKDKSSDLAKGIALLAASKAKRLASDKADVDANIDADTNNVSVKGGKGSDKGGKGANKARDKGNGQAIDKGKFDTHKLITWVKAAYDTTTLDRNNGTVTLVKVGNAHKKVIKQGTFENKQGVFFGSILNSTMADLSTDKAKNLTVLHSKSNVYKVVKPTLSYANMVALQTAIVKVCGKGKVAIGHGLTIDNTVK
ncbi:hypothetical protein LCGC14_2798840 [marine sediment metagenome]|uniref:Uncharacterized protein n=1 Tax=marine sediment metagenome TaxID=412755 RepID=A0A0F8YNG9_9ZZZZ